jgi:hypothetical protein
MKQMRWLAALSASLSLLVAELNGATLIFEPATGTYSDFGTLPQGYGNRIAATVQDGFLYSLDGGVTPNVVVVHSSGTLAQIYTWSADYGDLSHIVFAQEPKVFEMDLVADPGYKVTLSSFDMASWPHLNYTINSVQVLNQNSTVLFSQINPVILGSTSTSPQHTSFDFTATGGLTGTTIKILFDSTNVDSDDVGIDNIKFSQSTVPAVRGDFNRDGIVSAADIPVMLAALTDLNVYKSAYNVSDSDLITIGDVNHLGGVTNADIQAELDLVGGVTLAAVPEPNAANTVAAGMAMILMLLISRRSRRTGQLAGFR